MSVLERGQSFVKDMNEMNTSSVSKYFEIQREAVETFVEANRKREYYAAVQKNVQDSFKKQGELARDNFENTQELFKGLFNQDQDADEEAPVEEASAA
jgi:hypothetical protein